MKVGGSASASTVGGGAPRRPGAAAGFAMVGGAEPAGAAQAAAPSSAVAGLDALLMLQDVEDALARQRRAVRRADGLLDRLESLKLAMLGAGDASDALRRLETAVRERRGAVDDPRVLDLLDAVETRAAVELAKRDRSLVQAA